ncbi:MAG: signal peptidase I [Candidatus Woesearchaeota archaeon]
MRLLKLGVALVLVIVAIAVALANATYIDNDFSDKWVIEKGLKTYKEEICVDNFGDIACTENTYIECNGEEYKVPIMTGYTVKEKVFVPEYVKTECIEQIVIAEKPTGEEKASPVDRIEDSDVNVNSNSVRIDIRNAKWRKYIDSNSMDPLIDEGTTTIEIKPKDANEIKIGDIIAYDVDGYDYAFVHRVVGIKNDRDGVYFVTKGDNYYKEDPDKVRFSQVEGIVVGILY